MRLLSFLALLTVSTAGAFASADRPNIIVIFADDLGYGDLGCYGSPTIRTPHLDRMAGEGLRLTDFYAAAPLCTPSRAALLTGRYAVRSGMYGTRGVYFPDSRGGLPQSEQTLARVLQRAGYATALVGKWHLGVQPGGRPLDHGFDQALEVPYSNDMDRRPDLPASAAGLPTPPVDGWNVPLLRNGEVIERPMDQRTLTRRFTEEATRFIEDRKGQPFFLYLAHVFPHVPMFASPAFAGRSRAGPYGDAVEELDWSVGEILATLRRLGLEQRTLVIFTSDNGPWLAQRDQGGSAGPFREGKTTPWEGGQRVPALAWMPGRIAPGVAPDLAVAFDLFPTALRLAGVPAPAGVEIDGLDLSPLLFSRTALPERPFFYYVREHVQAARIGDWKLHYRVPAAAAPETAPLLYHLGRDPGERRNVAAQHPDVVARFQELLRTHLERVVPGPPMID